MVFKPLTTATQCSPRQDNGTWSTHPAVRSSPDADGMGKTTLGPAPQTCRQSCWSWEGLVRAGLWCVSGFGVCQGLCQELAGRTALLSALPVPSLGAPKGIDFPSSLFGFLINRNCSSLSATWQAKEIYGHRPPSPVFSGSVPRTRAPGSVPPLRELRVPPACGTPGPALQGRANLQQITKEKASRYSSPRDVVAVVTRLAKKSTGFSLP